MTSDSCTYCYNKFDADVHIPVLAPQSYIQKSTSILCESCNNFLLKKKQVTLVLKGQLISIEKFMRNEKLLSKLRGPENSIPKCEKHKSDVKGICKTHYIIVCADCESCKKCEIEQFNGAKVKTALEDLIAKYTKQNPRRRRGVSIPKGKLTIKNTYDLMKYLNFRFNELVQNCEDALKSKLLSYKKKVLNQATPILESTSEKLKNYDEFLNQVAHESQKKLSPFLGFPMPCFNGNDSSSGDDEINPPPGPHPDDSDHEGVVIDHYEYLRLQNQDILKLYSSSILSQRTYLTQTIFISHNVFDDFSVFGIAIGACPKETLMIINSLEISLQNKIISKEPSKMLENDDHNIVYQVPFKDPFVLKRGEQLKIKLDLEAREGFYMFYSAFSQNVFTFNERKEIFTDKNPCSILYIF
jgi:hypothetical protein